MLLPTQNKSAFSLIEIIIVISITSILILFSYLSYTSYLSSNKLTAAVNQVSADLRMVQNQAKTANKTAQIGFFAGSYQINNSKKVALPANVTANQKIFKFAGSGFPIPGYSGTLILECNGKNKKIIVSSVGRIRIEWKKTPKD